MTPLLVANGLSGVCSCCLCIMLRARESYFFTFVLIACIISRRAINLEISSIYGEYFCLLIRL